MANGDHLALCGVAARIQNHSQYQSRPAVGYIARPSSGSKIDSAILVRRDRGQWRMCSGVLSVRLLPRRRGACRHHGSSISPIANRKSRWGRGERDESAEIRKSRDAECRCRGTAPRKQMSEKDRGAKRCERGTGVARHVRARDRRFGGRPRKK